MKLSNKQIETMRKAYLITFAEFAVDTKEIAARIGLSVPETTKLMKKCDLVCGELIRSKGDTTDLHGESRKASPGKTIMWQCNQTYDSIDRAAAEKLFDDWAASK